MTSKAQLVRDNKTLRESNDYLNEKVNRSEVQRIEQYRETQRFLADLLVLEPSLTRFGDDGRLSDGKFRWNHERVHRAAEFARGHEAFHSVEREPDIAIHLQEAAK